VLVTTLLDDKKYPSDELVEVLKDRWAVEVNLRHLKTTMKMEVLRSRTKEGIARELWMFLIVYNLVRLIMLEASSRQKVPPDRISFADVLYWLRHGDLSRPMPEFQKNIDAGEVAINETSRFQGGLGGLEILSAQQHVHILCVADGGFIDAGDPQGHGVSPSNGVRNVGGPECVGRTQRALAYFFHGADDPIQ
jgi:hypothetical protein